MYAQTCDSCAADGGGDGGGDGGDGGGDDGDDGGDGDGTGDGGSAGDGGPRATAAMARRRASSPSSLVEA